MLHYYFKTSKEETFSPRTAPQEGCWIHVDDASAKDLEEICRLTAVPHTELVDALDKYELPRIERVQNTTLLFARHPIEQEAGLYTMTLTILLTPQYFITLSPRKNSLIHSILANPTPLTAQDSPSLLVHLLLKIVQNFTALIKRVRHSVLMQEKEITRADSEDITLLTQNEDILNHYMAALSPTYTMLGIFLSGKYADLYEKQRDFLEDLVHATKQAEELCSISLKSISNLKNSYQTIFTNNLHRTIKLLTSLTIIFSIPTTVASIFGMNVALPFTHLKHAFLTIMGVITAISLFILWIFHRKKWL